MKIFDWVFQWIKRVVGAITFLGVIYAIWKGYDIATRNAELEAELRKRKNELELKPVEEKTQKEEKKIKHLESKKEKLLAKEEKIRKKYQKKLEKIKKNPSATESIKTLLENW